MIQNEEVESDLFSFFPAAASELNFSSWANHWSNNLYNCFKKSNKSRKIEQQNIIVKSATKQIIRDDFESYSDGLIPRIWNYAKMSGFKEMQ